ncbi:MAG: CBS domain-containing protein [Planctomycetes bacterium]|nr:CBS domain-containing protein [Planctomycetota bacterium]
MSAPVHTCQPQSTLADAARLLWEHDCGLVPVVGRDGRVGATVTDRDICMAALLRGRRLDELRVAETMSKQVVTCSPDEDVQAAAERMVAQQVHRLPVVDADGKLQGILSLNDLALAGEADARLGREALRALVGISRHRSKVPAVVAPPATAKTEGKAPATASATAGTASRGTATPPPGR